MLELRDYQRDIIDAVRDRLRAGVRSVLIQLPTGGGKTVLTAKMIGTAARKDYRAWFTVHRRELIRQSTRTFHQVEIPHGIIAAQAVMDIRRRVQIASIQTLVRRLDRLAPPDLIVWDECISGDAIVPTDVGYLRIDEIPSSGATEVASFDGKEVVWKRITAWRRTGVKQTRRLLLADGREIRGTTEHPVMTTGGWKAIGEIAPGDRILCCPPLNGAGCSERSPAMRPFSTPTSDHARHGSPSIMERLRLSGHSTRRASSTASACVQASQKIMATVSTWCRSAARACRALWISTLSFTPTAVNASAAAGSSISALTGLPGGIATTARIGAAAPASSSIRRASAETAATWSPSSLPPATVMPPFTRMPAATVTSSSRRPLLRDLWTKFRRTFPSSCDTSWADVVSCHSWEPEPVYDISVEGTHCFFANGLLVHNCHHLAAGTWAKIYAQYPDAIHIGLSATPERLDGAGLSPFFQEMVHGPSVRELIDAGHLSPFRIFSMPSVSMEGVHHQGGDFKRKEVLDRLEKSTIIGDAVSHYLRHANGRRGIAFECSIERSERLAEQFRAAGVPAMHVDGNTDPGMRDRAMRDLESGHLKILTNVDLFGEGVDVPAIEVIHCCRPTDSLGLWLQQCGRGLRPSPGKDHCIIFDHAGNLQRHGPPDLEREWTLAGRKDERRGKGEGPGPRQCQTCYAMNPPAALVCLECRKPFPVQAREIEQVEGDLQEVEVSAMRRQAAHEQSLAEDYESLVRLGRIRGYRNPEGWAEHVARGRVKALRMKGRGAMADALEAQLPGRYSVRAS